MNWPWTEEERITFKNLDSEAWTEEETSVTVRCGKALRFRFELIGLLFFMGFCKIKALHFFVEEMSVSDELQDGYENNGLREHGAMSASRCWLCCAAWEVGIPQQNKCIVKELPSVR